MRHGTILRGVVWSSDVGGYSTSVLKMTTAAKDILRTISWPVLAALWIVTLVVAAIFVWWDPPDAMTSLVVGALGAWAILGMGQAFPRRTSTRRNPRTRDRPDDREIDPGAYGRSEPGRK
jgi:hypothetical protein